jgi:hypothetical protein
MTVAQMPSEIAQRIQLLAADVQTTLLGTDGMIFYGDQTKIPVTPTLCIEPGTTSRILAGVGGFGRTENQLQCFLLLYYAKVDTNQKTKLAADLCAEGIAYHFDKNPTLEREGDGGIVIHGFITSIEPGYSRRNEGKTLMHAVRLTWTGKSKTILGA